MPVDVGLEFDARPSSPTAGSVWAIELSRNLRVDADRARGAGRARRPRRARARRSPRPARRSPPRCPRRPSCAACRHKPRSGCRGRRAPRGRRACRRRLPSVPSASELDADERVLEAVLADGEAGGRLEIVVQTRSPARPGTVRSRRRRRCRPRPSAAGQRAVETRRSGRGERSGLTTSTAALVARPAERAGDRVECGSLRGLARARPHRRVPPRPSSYTSRMLEPGRMSWNSLRSSTRHCGSSDAGCSARRAARQRRQRLGRDERALRLPVQVLRPRPAWSACRGGARDRSRRPTPAVGPSWRAACASRNQSATLPERSAGSDREIRELPLALEHLLGRAAAAVAVAEGSSRLSWRACRGSSARSRTHGARAGLGRCSRRPGCRRCGRARACRRALPTRRGRTGMLVGLRPVHLDGEEAVDAALAQELRQGRRRSRSSRAASRRCGGAPNICRNSAGRRGAGARSYSPVGMLVSGSTHMRADRLPLPGRDLVLDAVEERRIVLLELGIVAARSTG